MERLSSLSTFSPSCSRPSSFFSNGGTGINTQPTNLRIKPIKSSRKPTLSTSWNISSPSMPRLEDLDTTNMLLRQRIVFLGSQVDDITADFIISQLLFLNAEDEKKDIKLFINSPGGSITAGMGIYDAMKLCKADVSTTCLGLAASMGAFLLAAGAKGKRYCMPNARVMIHQPSGTYGGRSTEMALRVREMAYHKIKLNKIFSRITGKPEDEIEEDCRYDKFMSPWEAKEYGPYGLIDEVIDDGKPGLVAPLADFSDPPKSQIWSLWEAKMYKDTKLLPSEEKLVQEGQTGVEESNEGKEAAPTTV